MRSRKVKSGKVGPSKVRLDKLGERLYGMLGLGESLLEVFNVSG